MNIIRFFSAISLMAVAPAFSQLTAAPPWQAEWIGIAAQPFPDLTQASWIWADTPDVDPARNAEPGTMSFHRQIDLPADAAISSATALIAADDRFKLSLNGKVLGEGSSWQKPVMIDFSGGLRAGANSLLIEVRNDASTGPLNAAGLIGEIRIELVGLPVREIVTDAAWTCTESASGPKPVKVIGALGSGPWSAMTVNPAAAQMNLWTCFRKKFTLAEKPGNAIARIAVDSKYWLWINGKLTVYEGGLKRGPNPRDSYFDTVDLAPFLQGGENTIAALAWYWGKDGFSHKNSGKPGFLFELEAGSTRILSDASWKVLHHPAFGRTGEPHPNYRLPDENAHFDARLDIGEWTVPAFDDATWKSAVPAGKPPVAPWNQLIERPFPQWRTSELRAYENAAELPKVSDGKPIIAHLPVNLSISPYLKIKAPAGLLIDIRTDNYKGGGEYNYRAEYITRDGVQEFESLPYLNGHWMIYSIPAGIEILDLRYRETRFNTDYIGSFESDDPFLDKLWIKSRNTMNLNMRDSIQDPDRERAQWWGDLVILMSQIFTTCNTNAHGLIKKGIDNLVDWQKPDGVLYSPIPAGSWDKELPLQMLASIGRYGFWNYYLHTGDKATIAHAYPAVKRYLALYQLGGDGLVVHRSGGWDWADWGENIDNAVIDNPWLYQALESAINMAGLTGNEADIPGYEATRKSIAENYNRLLWNGKEYRSPGYEGKTDDRGHSVAVLFGLAKPEQYPVIKEVFTREFHSSPYMEKYVLESLFQMNDADAALARMKSRYKKMVESELSTLWEGWGIGPEGYGGGSYNHGWAGGPLTLMMQYVAGVTPTTPAYATYQVRPQLGHLKRVRTVTPTLKGPVEVAIQREICSFQLKLISPANTQATVCIPLASYGLTAIRVGGKPLWLKGKTNGEIPGITPAGEADGYICFTVAPGIWTFEAL
jgi:alpha-L-rhamnosidase